MCQRRFHMTEEHHARSALAPVRAASAAAAQRRSRERSEGAREALVRAEPLPC